jgi:hypothetical protein
MEGTPAKERQISRVSLLLHLAENRRGAEKGWERFAEANLY